MATNTQLKFYKVQTLPASFVTGAIYFEVSTQRICVAKSTTEYDAFGVGLKGAALANDVLTITRWDNTTLTVDFSDVASAKEVASRLGTIESTLTSHNTRISTAQAAAEAAQADADALEKALGAGFSESSTVSSQLAAVKATADSAVTTSVLNAAVEPKADKTQVATDINAAKEAAIAAAATDATTKADAGRDAAKTYADGLKLEIDAAYAAEDAKLQKAIDDLVAGTVSIKHDAAAEYIRVTKAEGSTEYVINDAGINNAISSAVSVEASLREAAVADVQGNVNTLSATVSALIGEDTPKEGETQKSVRTITAEEVAKVVANAPEDYNTLAEIAAWIEAHPESVASLNASISANTTAIENEAKARTEADNKHTQDIADLVAADSAQDELIASKASQTDLDTANGKISTLEGYVGGKSVSGQITEKIETLDATVGSKTVSTNKHVAVEVVETDGLLTGLTVTEDNIASASDLTALTGRVAANEATLAALGSGEGSVGSQISNAINALNADEVSTEGTNIAVKVVQTAGKVSDVVITKDDTVSNGTHNALASRVTDLETAMCWQEFN